jgi:hypothetical protein
VNSLRLMTIGAALALAGCAGTGAKVTGNPSPKDAAKANASRAVATGPVLSRPEGPVPIRVPAQVMRIWIAPWEDTRGDLHAPGYVYTEIEPRRWTLGVPSAGTTERLVKPLQIERRDGAKAADGPGGRQERSSASPPHALSPNKGARQS